ncbi:MAG TPA: flavodoxin family protein [candidate division Zixibacteria bacterium]|nr:flavodoxin family protein [candidate division Zixibacteria bacterium]
MKVLGIVGSPRRGGNIETIVDEVLAGAKAAGADVEKIILNDMNISPCQACNSCSKTGKCKIDDDMNIINEKMKESSVFIYGTPIYYWGPTGQFKIFIDRSLATARQGIIKNKKIILAIPLGGSEPIARHTIGMLTDSINYQNAEVFGKIVSPNTMEIEDLRKKKDVLEKARKFGENVVKV